MRRALLLVALTAVSLAACDGEEAASPADSTPSPVDETVSSIPLEQRFPTAADAPGTKPDPVEKGQQTADFDEFIVALSHLAVDPDREEATQVFQEAGFKSAGEDVRFYGGKHEQTADHLFSVVIELETEEGARSALDWLATDAMKPCPGSCAVQVTTFDVDDIPDARGVHRSATAKDIESFGNPGERPFEGYWVAFTEGAFVYAVELRGSPRSVSEDEALEIASTYFNRVAEM